MARLALTPRLLRLSAALLLLASAVPVPAGAAGGGLPATFAVPAPLVGDAWTYAVLERDDASEGEAEDGEDRLLQRAFTQEGPSTARDPDGRPVGVALLAESQTWGAGERLDPVSWTYAVAQDGSVVSATSTEPKGGAEGELTATGLPGNVTFAQAVSEFHLLSRTVHGVAPFCGHRSALQGQDAPLGKGVLLHGCGRFTALAMRDWSGRPALVLGLASDPQRLQAWFVADVPVPVRVFEQVDADTTRILELAQFTRGSEPVSYGSVEGIEPLPALAWAPRLPHGLDEAGVEHPFPLSAAYSVASLTSDSFGRFLAEHPRAYLRSAEFTDLRENEQTHVRHDRTWFLVASDGAEAAAVKVRHSTMERADVPGLPPAELLPGAAMVEDADAGEGPWPAPDAVPGEMPTVASLVARWEALEETGTPNGWGFRLSCGATCGEARLEAWAGGDERHRPNPPRAGLVIAWVEERRFADFAAVDASGRTAWREEWAWVQRSRIDATPLATLASGAPPAAPVSAPGGGAPLDVSWTAVAATAGAVVGFAILLAWLAKAGPLAGLFSRQIDDVAAHPVRAAVLEAVRAEPGIHHSELMRRVGKGNAVVSHHVRRLSRAGLVSARQGSRFLCYYPAGTPRAAQVAAPLVKSGVAQRLLQAVAVAPASGQDLARRLGVEPGAVAYHVKRLSEAGLVSTRREGRFVLVEATAEGRTVAGPMAA